MRVRNTKDDCVAVWRCAGDAACADATARTTHVLDDNWLPKRSPHGLGQHARNYIGGAARSIWYYYCYWSRRISLRLRDKRCEWHRSGAGNQMKELSPIHLVLLLQCLGDFGPDSGDQDRRCQRRLNVTTFSQRIYIAVLCSGRLREQHPQRRVFSS